MRERFFRFKQFAVSHSRSAMKVGVDAVLLGSWARIERCTRILDAGCGCGIVALMCAQRNPESIITGIDIDSESVTEAQSNVSSSCWSNRISIICEDYLHHLESLKDKYDVVISNPPYFESGIENASDRRLRSRHAITLSPEIILSHWQKAITKEGRIIMIYPFEYHKRITAIGIKNRIYPRHSLGIKGMETGKIKRILTEFTPENSEEIFRTLTIEKEKGVYSDEYKRLTSPFYLKF